MLWFRKNILPFLYGISISSLKADSKWYESLINQNDNYFSDKQNNILLKTNKNKFEKELLDLILRDFEADEDGRNNELLKIRLEIDSLVEKGYGKKSKMSSKAKYRLGRIYRVLGDYKKAESYYKECIKIQSEIKDKDPEFVSDVMNSLGLVLYEQGKYNKAEINNNSFYVCEGFDSRNDVPHDIPKTNDVTFIGNIYGNRKDIVLFFAIKQI